MTFGAGVADSVLCSPWLYGICICAPLFDWNLTFRHDLRLWNRIVNFESSHLDLDVVQSPFGLDFYRFIANTWLSAMCIFIVQGQTAKVNFVWCF